MKTTRLATNEVKSLWGIKAITCLQRLNDTHPSLTKDGENMEDNITD
jgi:hypothetical protein